MALEAISCQRDQGIALLAFGNQNCGKLALVYMSTSDLQTINVEVIVLIEGCANCTFPRKNTGVLEAYNI